MMLSRLWRLLVMLSVFSETVMVTRLLLLLKLDTDDDFMAMGMGIGM